MNKDENCFDTYTANPNHPFQKIQKELDVIEEKVRATRACLGGKTRKEYGVRVAEDSNDLLLVIAKQLQGIWGDMP